MRIPKSEAMMVMDTYYDGDVLKLVESLAYVKEGYKLLYCEREYEILHIENK